MKKYLAVSVILIMALFTISACGSKSTTAKTTSTSQASATMQASTSQVSTGQASSLIAEGHLLPVKSLDESFTLAGRVDQVLVKDGDSVQAGQTLVQLDNAASAQLTLAQAEQEALAAQQALDDVQNSNVSNATAELNLALAQTAYNTALSNYWNRNTTQGSADVIAVNQAKLTILDQKIADLAKTYANQGELADSDVKKAQTLQDLSQARVDRVNLKNLLDYYKTNPDSLDVETLKAKLDLAKSSLDDAKRVWKRMQNGIDPNELAAAQARVKTANAAVASAQSTLDALQLSAGMAGTVVDTNVLPGQQVTAGQTLLSVADYSSWIVQTDNLTETDVVNIHLGQEVQIVPDALPDVTLKGKVTHIDNRFALVNGDITYVVTVTLEQTDPRIRWGMTTAVKFVQ
jgi:multidrug resistance efflux pump